MASKESYYIQTNVLKALINIIDEFPEFNTKLMKFLKNSKDYKDSMFNIGAMDNGNKVYHAKNDKKFYLENKETIDKISKYSNFFEFICCNYSINEVRNKNILFFYNYIINNKNKIPNILELLDYFTSIGIQDINFVNDSFTEETFEYDYTTRFGSDYFENMYAIPTILPNKIVYKTQGSNYRLYTNNRRCITVNNLLFSKECFPKELNDNLIREIIALKDTIQEENKIIKNSVILNVTLDDLYNQYEETNRLIESLDGIENKKEILNTLKRISKQIKRIETIRNNYNYSNQDKIDPNVLNEEKMIYRKTRNHIDYNSK